MADTHTAVVVLISHTQGAALRVCLAVRPKHNRSVLDILPAELMRTLAAKLSTLCAMRALRCTSCTCMEAVNGTLLERLRSPPTASTGTGSRSSDDDDRTLHPLWSRECGMMVRHGLLDEGNALEMTHAREYRSFEAMGLRGGLIQGVRANGIHSASRLQQRLCVPITARRDVLALAPSGTGKTAAFVIALLELIDPARHGTQALAVCYKRELCQAVAGVFRSVIRGIAEPLRASVLACVAGGGAQEEAHLVDALRGGVHVVVGTPDRVHNMIGAGHLCVEALRCLVVDELNVCLARGFGESLAAIRAALPEAAAVGATASTLSETEVTWVGAQLRLRRPVLVLQPPLVDTACVGDVRQFYVGVGQEEAKWPVLCALLGRLDAAQAAVSAVVFVSTRRKLDWLASRLRARSVDAGVLHADLDESEQDALVAAFNAGAPRILLATDAFGRHRLRATVAFDAYVVLAISYDVPNHRDGYAHRVCCSQVAISLCNSYELRQNARAA
mmetsp:Transcript_93/g.289  ORF Transcript_93/g.289 Transcript_93/m.289 type:complete len:503 (+) Transcript_93:172-1680(+)